MITKRAMIFAYIYDMVIFIVLTGLVVCVALGYWWLRAVNAFFKLFEPKKNPYVEAHKAKIKGDATYQEYLLWLDKRGGDIPLEKLKTKEEIQFEEKIRRAEREHGIKNMFRNNRN